MALSADWVRPERALIIANPLSAVREFAIRLACDLALGAESKGGFAAGASMGVNKSPRKRFVHRLFSLRGNWPEANAVRIGIEGSHDPSPRTPEPRARGPVIA